MVEGLFKELQYLKAFSVPLCALPLRGAGEVIPKIRSSSWARPRANTGMSPRPPRFTMSWTVLQNRASRSSLFSWMWVPYVDSCKWRNRAVKGLTHNSWSSLNPTKMQTNTLVSTCWGEEGERSEREKSKPPPSSQNHPTKANNQNFPSPKSLQAI